MRIASFNVENLFDRAKAMDLDTWKEGRPVLEKFAALNSLLGESDYTAARKRRMVQLLADLGLEKSDTGPFVLLRRNHGGLLKRPKSGGIEITAEGRADWIGSLELRDETVNEQAIRNTGSVLRDIHADIVGIVEAESRPVLVKFNDEMIGAEGGSPYCHAMLIDGNDDRGIDVGILTGQNYPIVRMTSHVDDCDGKGERIFSRDCPEFTVQTSSGVEILVMVNHLKSKGFGSQSSSNARRKAQAARVKKIYEERSRQGIKYIAVVGDFNDTPASDAIAPLLKNTDLKDVFEHPKFDDGGYPGTYDSCTESNKIDYILLSPKLFALVTSGFVMRKGMWPGTRPRKWECYPEVTKPEQAASDHAAVCVDINL